IVIPKASSTAHLRDNLDLFDWQLGDEEMARLDGVGSDPD
ncbi:MAG: aldo/keto reductase, partial [Gemmatimonadetes bacterium]|nr:aldo/keto reductase [Gemmatimonadota bacterium]